MPGLALFISNHFVNDCEALDSICGLSGNHPGLTWVQMDKVTKWGLLSRPRALEWEEQLSSETLPPHPPITRKQRCPHLCQKGLGVSPPGLAECSSIATIMSALRWLWARPHSDPQAGAVSAPASGCGGQAVLSWETCSLLKPARRDLDAQGLSGLLTWQRRTLHTTPLPAPPAPSSRASQ